MTLIYKLLRENEWEEFKQKGETQGAPVDLQDGFIHFSTKDQLVETAKKHFKDVSPIHIISVESESLGDALKWEISRGGALFPHLYANLKIENVVSDNYVKSCEYIRDFALRFLSD